MRIAYVSADRGVPVFGRKGCSIHVQEILRAWSGFGARITLLTPRAEGPPPPDLEGIRLEPLPLATHPDRGAREQADLAANRDLRDALERSGSFDLIYERYSLWSYAAQEFARGAGIPGLLEVNAPLIDEQAEHRGLVDRPAAEAVARRVFAAAHSLIAVSEEVAAYLHRFPGAPARTHVVPNGVNPERFPVGVPPSIPSSCKGFTVGFVGSLKPWHGLETLAEAFALLSRQHASCRLLIVGDGPGRSRLEDELTVHGVQNATVLTGAVPADEIPGLLASMDVGVAPYPRLAHFYFSPLKVYEYLAAGLPVVASRIGQLEQIIRDGHNGLLYPAGDARALASALERLRTAPAWRARLGQEARAQARQKHTWQAAARRLLEIAGLTSDVEELSGRSAPHDTSAIASASVAGPEALL
jgi:glycosyltransferase involved in cell wall biosynthesis